LITTVPTLMATTSSTHAKRPTKTTRPKCASSGTKQVLVSAAMEKSASSFTTKCQPCLRPLCQHLASTLIWVKGSHLSGSTGLSSRRSQQTGTKFRRAQRLQNQFSRTFDSRSILQAQPIIFRAAILSPHRPRLRLPSLHLRALSSSALRSTSKTKSLTAASTKGPQPRPAQRAKMKVTVSRWAWI